MTHNGQPVQMDSGHNFVDTKLGNGQSSCYIPLYSHTKHSNHLKVHSLFQGDMPGKQQYKEHHYITIYTNFHHCNFCI